MFHVEHFENWFCGNPFERGNSRAQQGLWGRSRLGRDVPVENYAGVTGVSHAAVQKVSNEQMQ